MHDALKTWIEGCSENGLLPVNENSYVSTRSISSGLGGNKLVKQGKIWRGRTGPTTSTTILAADITDLAISGLPYKRLGGERTK